MHAELCASAYLHVQMIFANSLCADVYASAYLHAKIIFANNMCADVYLWHHACFATYSHGKYQCSRNMKSKATSILQC